MIQFGAVQSIAGAKKIFARCIPCFCFNKTDNIFVINILSLNRKNLFILLLMYIKVLIILANYYYVTRKFVKIVNCRWRSNSN
jgi:hypothetical protein